MSGIMTEIQFYSNIVVGVSVFISAVTVIIQTCTKFNPLNGIRNWFIQPVKEVVDKHTIQLEELKIAKLKSDVCNPNLPIEERLKAGKIYVEDMHLNAEVKTQYKLLQELYEKSLRCKGEKNK